jgi:hypothetical protein
MFIQNQQLVPLVKPPIHPPKLQNPQKTTPCQTPLKTSKDNPLTILDPPKNPH